MRLNLINRALMISIWDDFTFELSLNQSLLTTLDSEARWAIKNRFVDADNIPNYFNFIYLTALKTLLPDNVSVIH